jgi:repressor LexA
VQGYSPEKVKEARLAQGLSQLRLARLIGVSEQSVANWEAGRVKQIRSGHLRALARVTGRPIAWFQP